ncbi:GSCOCG00011229001-RA-CDS [Cotesia congregata]|nr:GSCOCG00011229001-RA-CDS [Cotesia congregata]
MGKGKGLLEKGVHVGHTGGDNVQGKAEGKRWYSSGSKRGN